MFRNGLGPLKSTLIRVGSWRVDVPTSDVEVGNLPPWMYLPIYYLSLFKAPFLQSKPSKSIGAGKNGSKDTLLKQLSEVSYKYFYGAYGGSTRQAILLVLLFSFKSLQTLSFVGLALGVRHVLGIHGSLGGLLSLRPLCGVDDKDVHHILISCSRVLLVWRKVWSLWNLDSLVSFPSFDIGDVACVNLPVIGDAPLAKVLNCLSRYESPSTTTSPPPATTAATSSPPSSAAAASTCPPPPPPPTATAATSLWVSRILQPTATNTTTAVL
ncbi:hypothetical protein Tco_0833156 [Tanacetum coccineum]